ncbi:MAG: glycosyltransferase [Bacteroidetes bacterium]|nr:glycosyltransferase [Bacteroidota bacterium]HET6244843.1 glycosyltransferase [Bacteroidia bacterium]
MKKVILVGSAHPFRGGLAVFNERLIREFQNLGYKAEIYTFTIQYPGFLFPGKTQFSDSPSPDDLKISRLVNSVNPLNWIKIGNRIRKEKPEILIFKFWLPFMGPCFGTIARIAKRNNKTKIACILDNVIPHESRPGDKQLTAYFLKPVDAFIAMSDSVLKDLDFFDKAKPRKISPHPLFDNFGAAISKNEACARLGISDEYNYLLFFGFIRDYKGLDLLLNAFSDSRMKDKKLKLIVAGEFYSDKTPYLQLIEELGIKNQVILKTDFIPDEKVVDYFCASDLVVQPYKHATQSGVTQIAYHFEKPMIVTNVGGLPELVPDGKVGFVVPVDPRAISDAIIQFFDGDYQQKFSHGIQVEKQKFTWDKMVRNIEAVISEISSK